MMRLAGLWLTGTLLGTPVGAEPIRPAELPPGDYAGQQYVDSKGCLFLRAGTPGRPTWIPRVTRKGTPICGQPPSGRRLPVAEDDAAVGVAAGTAAPSEAGTGGWFVAVGRFRVAANVDKALARLQALGFPATPNKARGGAGLVTVLAGPFESGEVATRAWLDLRAEGFPDAVLVAP